MRKTKSEKVKILMLNYEFPPLGGGAANATYYLLKEFSKIKDLEIDLVTSSTDKFRIQQFAPNIKIHFLDIGKDGNLHYQSQKDLLKYSWKAYKYSKQLMKEKGFNLCHAFFGIPCGFIAMKLGLPYLVSLRGSDVPGHNPKFKLLDKLIFKRLSKKIWNKSKLTIANSKDLRDEAYLTSKKKEIKIIVNGIDTSFYKPTKKENSMKKFRIFYAGRLSIVKGLDFLLKALSQLDKNSELILAGDGDQKDHLQELSKKLGIKNQVKFLGILNKEDLRKEYLNASVFCLPSLHEGMSNTVLEAMACGLSIVITNTGGVNLLMKDNGIVVKSESSEELFLALKKIKENKELRNNMGKKSREIAEKMSWKNMAKSYLEIYRK
jgi:L-malate glycosyltransferase